MTEAIDTETVGAFRVEVHYDQDCESPRDWDNVGTIYGDGDFADRECRIDEAWRVARHELGPIVGFPIRQSSDRCALQVCQCGWDDADGVYVVSLEHVIEEGWPGSIAERLASARDCLRAELDTLSQWGSGDCYGYVVVGPDGETVDSCWGFIGEPEYALSQGRSAAAFAEGERWERWASVPEWMRQSVLAHQ